MKGVFKYLKLPNEVKMEDQTDTFGKFSFEPLNEGYAVTIGNALRRVLLSSVPGIAIIGIEIDGVDHEFSSIDGIKEDVMNIILNLRQVRFKALNDNFETAEVYLKKSTPGKLTASDLEIPGNLEIINKDVYIAELMNNASINATIFLKKGIGYEQADAEEINKEIGYIPVDALFSPIKRVAYRSEKSTMKDYYAFEKLVLEIETDGSVTPIDALQTSSYILSNYVSLFSGGDFKEADLEVDSSISSKSEDMNENLLKTVDELELNVRASNCLSSHGIKYICDLVRKTDTELLSTKNFGKQSLKEIKEALKQLGLDLGMKLTDEQVNTIKKAIEERGVAENEE
jgi:DNA-directed RNA polymerase subunit alpha